MRRLILALVLSVFVSAPLVAQDPLWSIDIVRCAIGGQHQEGCGLSPASCTFEDYLLARCTADPAPQPEPEPDPIAPTLTVPTELHVADGAVAFRHDGLATDWFTLRLDDAYHAHVGGNAVVDGTATIPLDPALPAGTYVATVLACSDALGCVSSSPLEVVR